MDPLIPTILVLFLAFISLGYIQEYKKKLEALRERAKKEIGEDYEKFLPRYEIITETPKSSPIKSAKIERKRGVRYVNSPEAAILAEYADTLRLLHGERATITDTPIRLQSIEESIEETARERASEYVEDVRNKERSPSHSILQDAGIDTRNLKRVYDLSEEECKKLEDYLKKMYRKSYKENPIKLFLDQEYHGCAYPPETYSMTEHITLNAIPPSREFLEEAKKREVDKTARDPRLKNIFNPESVAKELDDKISRIETRVEQIPSRELTHEEFHIYLGTEILDYILDPKTGRPVSTLMPRIDAAREFISNINKTQSDLTEKIRKKFCELISDLYSEISRAKKKTEYSTLNEGVAYGFSQYYAKRKHKIPESRIYINAGVDFEKAEQVKDLATDLMYLTNPETVARMAVDSFREAYNENKKAPDVFIERAREHIHNIQAMFDEMNRATREAYGHPENTRETPPARSITETSSQAYQAQNQKTGYKPKQKRIVTG